MVGENSSPEQQTLSIQQAIDLGVEHQTAGRLPEAEAIYTQKLQTEPNHSVALHLLGVIAHQVGKNDIAVDLITKALAVNPDYAEAHYNLGFSLKAQGQLEEAVASYQKAIAIKPEYTEAHNNLGIVFGELGKLDEAATSFHNALAITPDHAEAHNNLGRLLRDLCQYENAVVCCQKALAIEPDLVETHFNLGLALRDLEKIEDAANCFRKALTIKPDYAEAHFNLGLALQDLGQHEDAFTHHRRAIALEPENDLFWAEFAQVLGPLTFTSVDDNLWQDLLHLLERPTVRPTYVIRPIISALRHHHSFAQILALTGSGNPEIGIANRDATKQLSAIPLFLRIMVLCPIDDLEIERMLTFLRRAMITETLAGKTDEKGLPFSAALALHCFTDEYIFPETDEEKAAVEQLQQQIAALVEKKRDVPPSFVAALSAYRPLHSFSWARELGDQAWASDIVEVIERQISEPLEERSLRSQIPRLTSIQDTVSQLVREQYEENPYPRWIKTGLYGRGRAIGTVLQKAPIRIDLGDYQSTESPEILVAGCGTGQHSLVTATRFSNARVLAVDLTLSSLSYARRKTNELGLPNIEYAQADIMELGGIGRQFDLIDSVGVLHHLSDPLAGWKVLVGLLRPGGADDDRPIQRNRAPEYR